jgi:hypothetical protein
MKRYLPIFGLLLAAACPGEVPGDAGSSQDGGAVDAGDDAGTADAGYDAGTSADDAGPPVDCFPAMTNDNLTPTSFGAGPLADQGVVCDAANAAELDGDVAGLGYGGGAPVLVGDELVTACLVADLQKRCTTDTHVGVGLSIAPIGEVCGDPGGIEGQEQCSEALACSALPGAEVAVFAGDSLDDMRFLAHVGNCGEGQSIQTLTPLTALADAADLASVRYLMVCRPAERCGATDGNVAVDALYLTWR